MPSSAEKCFRHHNRFGGSWIARSECHWQRYLSGIVTDVTGRFVISILEESNTLLFSFVGFISWEVKIGNQTEADVALLRDIKRLDEVVVTALNIERSTKHYTLPWLRLMEIILQWLVRTALPNALAG